MKKKQSFSTKKDSEIENKVVQVFLKTFGNINVKTFDLEKSRNDFENWDSLAHLQLVSEIESEFGINLAMDEIVDINKPRDFVTLICKKRV